ncbi:hypothetical protein [Amycolatopsis sp. A1MSW2902]|uniref:hypothetical protein n=1 Tax=Amycolatopsis sp. A1MSW2902 TaxID=687413 RepID=UPI00307F193E
MPSTLVELLKGATRDQRKILVELLNSKKTYNGEISASANLLGKNYVKQVDVVMSAWNTGPELMISTKRMDSSFGNNAANRVEESYGDAKNLRGRHPQAALGFIYGLNHAAFLEKPRVAAWIVDLLGKLGREDDAYDAVALVVPEWVDADGVELAADSDAEEEDPLVVAGVEEPADAEEVLPLELSQNEADEKLRGLPNIRINTSVVPEHLSPGSFFGRIIGRVLDNCPVNFHEEARFRRSNPEVAS